MRIRSLGMAALAWAGLAAAGSLAAVSLAAVPVDEVETNDGRKIEGKVVSQEKGIVKIQTRFGTIELARGDVKRISIGPTIAEQHETKKKEAKTGEDFYQLSRWCAEKGLTKESKEALALAVEADPKHEAAHRALGHVKDGEEWVTLDEKRARDKERERKELAAKGLVEYQGRWVTVEERDALAKGLVRDGDRWVTPEAANRAKGLELFEGKWIPAMEAFARANLGNAEKAIGGKAWTKLLGKHVVVAGTHDEPYLEAVSTASEKAFSFVDRLYGGDGEGSVILKGTVRSEDWKPNLSRELLAASERRPTLSELWVFEGDAEYERAADYVFGESRRELGEGWSAGAKRAFGFQVPHPVGRSVVVSRGRDKSNVAGHVCHNLTHVLAHRHIDTPMFLPPWYDEALALLTEDAAMGSITMFCAVPATSGSRVENPQGPKSEIRSWRDRLRDANKAGRCRPLAAIVTRDLFDLTVEDLLKCASVLEYLASRGSLEPFHAFLQTSYGYARLPENAKEIHDKAFRAAMKDDMRGAEALWERWFSGAAKK